MAGKFIFDKNKNINLQFVNFEEWKDFCELCEKWSIPATTDPDNWTAVISRASFENLPNELREAFAIQDAETSKKILEARRNQLRRIRRATPVSLQEQIEREKFIDLILPPALMPRVK